MTKRTIITLAVGSQYYSRMALALMLSCRRYAGDRLDYIIFSEQEYLPYYRTPSWLQVKKVSNESFSDEKSSAIKSRGFYLKSILMMEPMLHDRTVLFLDADCWVFADCFDEIFGLIEKDSIVIYGGNLKEGELWGKINFPQVAKSAGISVTNMWLNSGIFGRAADPLGYSFARLYKELMAEYPFKKYIKSEFWKAADEPYLAAAYQMAHIEHQLPVPENIKSFSSDLFMTTWLAKVSDEYTGRPSVSTTYLGHHTHRPAIIHFLGGIRIPYYRKLINGVVTMTTVGKFLKPVFSFGAFFDRARIFIHKLVKN